MAKTCYYYFLGMIHSRRGEISLWGAIGIVLLVMAYVTFPQVFEGFFDWIRSYFTDGLEEMQDGKGNRGPDWQQQQPAGDGGKQK